MKGTMRCGTNSSYTMGCRCALCKRAHADCRARERQRIREEGQRPKQYKRDDSLPPTIGANKARIERMMELAGKLKLKQAA